MTLTSSISALRPGDPPYIEAHRNNGRWSVIRSTAAKIGQAEGRRFVVKKNGDLVEVWRLA